jgi:hypothetical protein
LEVHDGRIALEKGKRAGQRAADGQVVLADDRMGILWDFSLRGRERAAAGCIIRIETRRPSQMPIVRCIVE